MRLHLPANSTIMFALAAAAQAAAPIELELATERGMQITAPHEWLQLLTSLGVDNVRIRTAAPGDQPKLENLGSDDRPRYRIVGVITARQELLLPGGTFQRNDRRRIREYFERLAAEGGEAIAPRGRFGLTENELKSLHVDLAQTIDFDTKGLSARAAIDQLQTKLTLHLLLDAAAEQTIRNARPLDDEVRGLTAGTGMAIMLRPFGLVLRPEKPLGKPTLLHIAAADPDEGAWPIGWEPERSTGRVAPALMESVNVEIDGYTLAEAIGAIAPRVKLPIFWDHAKLAERKIDPATVQVKLARTRTFYKRVLDRILAQARLAPLLRVDEAGTAFLWITL